MSVSCKSCMKIVKKPFLEDHLKFWHFGYLPYKCLHKNCSHESTSLKINEIHCRLKHDAEPKILVFGDSFVDRVCKWLSNLHNSSSEADKDLLLKFFYSKTFLQCRKIIEELRPKFLLKKRQLRENFMDLEKSDEISMNCLVSPDSNTTTAKSFLSMKIKKELCGEYEEFEKFYHIIVEEPKEVSPLFAVPIKLEVVEASDIPCSPLVQPVSTSPVVLQRPRPYKKRVRQQVDRSKIRDDWPCKPFKDGTKWRIPCRVCKFAVRDQVTSRRKHALKHVPEKTDIKWLFKCMCCPSEISCCKSLYFDVVVEKHIPRKHLIPYPKIDKDYINRNAELKDEMDAVYFMCFPY